MRLNLVTHACSAVPILEDISCLELPINPELGVQSLAFTKVSGEAWLLLGVILQSDCKLDYLLNVLRN